MLKCQDSSHSTKTFEDMNMIKGVISKEISNNHNNIMIPHKHVSISDKSNP